MSTSRLSSSKKFLFKGVVEVRCAVCSSEYHPSIRSPRVSNIPILKAIEKSEELIVSEDDLLSFLSHTKFSTFGVFKPGEKCYLVMLIPKKYASNMSYSCQLFCTP